MKYPVYVVMRGRGNATLSPREPWAVLLTTESRQAAEQHYLDIASANHKGEIVSLWVWDAVSGWFHVDSMSHDDTLGSIINTLPILHLHQRDVFAEALRVHFDPMVVSDDDDGTDMVDTRELQ